MNRCKRILYRFGFGSSELFSHGLLFPRRRESSRIRHLFGFRIKSGMTILTINLALLMISCGETHMSLEEATGGEAASLIAQMDPKEKEEVVTNELFEAVLDNKPEEEIDKILSDTNISVTSVNKRGDTSFGVAIQFKRKEKALLLVEKLQCEDLSHQNNKGESYLYLASREGYVELIHRIADKCYENDMLDFSDYEFSDVDPETLNGEIAIHVALNGAVAEALDYEYTRGTLEYSWFVFHKGNDREESFLHKAVQDNRVNTVEWAVRTYCDESEWEQSESSWKQIPASIWNYISGGFQTYIYNVAQLVNYQDVENNTALHLAAQSLNTKIIRILSDCRWMDYLIENKNGNIALQVFLESLDDKLKNHSQEIKDTFVFLIHREIYFKEWVTNISDTVDHQNKNDDSSLHISARLADPFFYNYLKKLSNVNLRNKEGRTPEEIFDSTRSKIKNL